jgi:GNAT superfamily N-acetyltransferase
MARAPPRADSGGMPEIAIGAAAPEELPAASALLRRSLGFRAADAVPPWLMLTVADHGGICLVARAAGTVVGASFAFPAREHLFSCGLAVHPSHRGRSVGRRLKLAQAEAARELGFTAIEWTADPLNGAALRLYLGSLGARLTRYHAGLYDAVRPAARTPQDDVTISWPLTGVVPASGPVRAVVVPWSAGALADDEWSGWRARVRAEMRALLEDGWIGTGVRPGANGTCTVVFSEPPHA